MRSWSSGVRLLFSADGETCLDFRGFVLFQTWYLGGGYLGLSQLISWLKSLMFLMNWALPGHELCLLLDSKDFENCATDTQAPF